VLAIEDRESDRPAMLGTSGADPKLEILVRADDYRQRGGID
jgi:hypothetical protein